MPAVTNPGLRGVSRIIASQPSPTCDKGRPYECLRANSSRKDLGCTRSSLRVGAKQPTCLFHAVLPRSLKHIRYGTKSGRFAGAKSRAPFRD